MAEDERRYYGLDALRGVMMLLGIVLHTAMLYAPLPPIPVNDRRTSPLFAVVVLFIHDFRMPLFFLLSGFFWALLVGKYGLPRAYRNRAARILAPLLLGVLTLVPPATWLILSFGVSAEAGRLVAWTTSPEHLEWARRLVPKLNLEPGRAPAPAHLWFLYYLLLFYLGMPVCVAARHLLERQAWRQAAGRLMASAWLPLALGVWTAASLWPHPGAWVGFQYLRPKASGLLYYGTFFVLGYLYHGFRDGLLATCRRHAGAYALAGGAAFLAGLAPSAADYRTGGGDFRLHLLTVALHGCSTWLLVYAAIGVFQRYFDRDGPWVAYISQSSYWVYLVHLPLAVLAGWALVAVDVPAAVKFVLAASFTTVVSFASYHHLVRRTWISVLLNGRRFTLGWPWRAPASAGYSLPMEGRSRG